MGRLLCGAHISVEFDDRVLAHLQVVIGAKLRRNESLLFSWRDSSASGDGRTTVWIHPTADLAFKFYGHRKPTINPAWVELLMLEANKAGGLQLIPEPDTGGSVPIGYGNLITASGIPHTLHR